MAQSVGALRGQSPGTPRWLRGQTNAGWSDFKDEPSSGVGSQIPKCGSAWPAPSCPRMARSHGWLCCGGGGCCRVPTLPLPQHIGLPMFAADRKPKRIHLMSLGVLNLPRNVLLDWSFGHSLISCHVEHHLFPSLSDNMCLKVRWPHRAGERVGR